MLCVLCLYLKVAIFQPELWEHAPHTTSVLAIFHPRATFVLKSCDFQARGESNPRPRDCESRRANHETTSKGQFASNKKARRHSESASTHTISAKGFAETKKNSHGATARALRHARSRNLKNAKNLEFLHLDHADLRRGLRGHMKKRKKPRVFAPRPRRSPQRVARECPKNAKNLEFLHLDHADLHRGSRGNVKNAKKNSSLCTSTTPISAEGRSGISKNAKNLEFWHLDHADLRRGSHSR